MRERLDQVLLQQGLVKSRSRARDLIRRAAVRVDGAVAAKPAMMVSLDANISVDEVANAYVARSGAKLVAGLDAFKFSATGCVALDVGASTGGFTQVLLENGARRVYAVDVGHGQLDASLAADGRVIGLEGRDIRRLGVDDIPEQVAAIVVDVSFISLTQALPAALAFAAPGCWLIALVKPQFEVGRDAIGKRGIVRKEADIVAVLSTIEDLLKDAGLRVHQAVPSPLPGKVGNLEYLIGAVLDA
jgi:23S rRNA (cytidine1920-2'-O)/16S rRNA (cytidine1409-2'-O)-methyltransferase